MDEKVKKPHHKTTSGGKAYKKKKDNDEINLKEPDKRRNPKAFMAFHGRKGLKAIRRTLDQDVKRMHVHQRDHSGINEISSLAIEDGRDTIDPPPVIVAVVGPKGVGKSTLISSMVKHYTKRALTSIKGPITLVSGKKRRLTFIECPNDLNSMCDVAKVADLIMLLIDAKFGFEMETFEFLNILQIHGFPKVMGVLTHLDQFKDIKKMRDAKKALKNRFWTEIYQGAKLFYLSGLINDKSYPKMEIANLARFVSVMKFRPLVWRNSHPYVLVDRIEDLTDPEEIRKDASCDRKVTLYGFVHGTFLKDNMKVHIPGSGDTFMNNVSILPDPCPIAGKVAKHRTLNDREKILYAPMSDVGDLMFDNDAVYLNIPNQQYTQSEDKTQSNEKMAQDALEAPGVSMVHQLHKIDKSVNELIDDSSLQIFSNSAPIKSVEMKSVDQEPSNSDPSDSDSFNDEIESKSFSSDGLAPDSDNKWKENMISKAGKKLEERRAQSKKSLMSLVYGNDGQESESDEESDDDEFFKIRSSGNNKVNEYFSVKQRLLDEMDNQNENIDYDNEDDIKELLTDRILNKKEEEEEVYGDFEDLEANQEENNSSKDFSDQSEDDQVEYSDEDAALSELLTKGNVLDIKSSNEHGGAFDEDGNVLLSKKKSKKAMFDKEYDDKKNKKGLGIKEEEEEEELDYYDTLGNKKPPTLYELEKQKEAEIAVRNAMEFEEDGIGGTSIFRGYGPGSYVRVELSEIPCEFIENFSPYKPVIIGGLLPNEHSLGFIQVRIKKHRWFDKILKTNNPISLSVGWRRFQSLPLFSMESVDGKNRMLKYTPEHMHCLATFYGPITPPQTGILGWINSDDKQQKFRIAATGVVTELDENFEIVKKLKLTGTPLQIFRNTAMVKDMFNSSLEVAKFQGASIRTVSGIRGEIKKAVPTPEGCFRATFEDKILMSDIVFLRTWISVKPIKFYNPIQTLLTDKPALIKTVGEIRREKQIPLVPNVDSLYTDIERAPRKFNPLHIPKKLEKDLPFSSKPKQKRKRQDTSYAVRRAVMREPEEKKATSLLQQLRTIRNDKQEIRKKVEMQQRKRYLEKQEKEEKLIDKRRKLKRKEEYRQRDKRMRYSKNQ